MWLQVTLSHPESKPCSDHRWIPEPGCLLLGGLIVGSLRSCWTLERLCQGTVWDLCPSTHSGLDPLWGQASCALLKAAQPLAVGQEARVPRKGAQGLDGWNKDMGYFHSPAPTSLCSGVPAYPNSMQVYSNSGVKNKFLEHLCQILAWSSFLQPSYTSWK